jgi:hypothetical protein
VGCTQRQDEADKETANKLLSTIAELSSKAVIELKRTAPLSLEFLHNLGTKWNPLPLAAKANDA